DSTRRLGELSRHFQLSEHRDQTPFLRGHVRVCERRKYRGSCKHKTIGSSLLTAQTCIFCMKLTAQCLAACRASILAETLGYGGACSSPWRGKRRVVERCKPVLMDQLQTSTHAHKLSEDALVSAVGHG